MFFLTSYTGRTSEPKKCNCSSSTGGSSYHEHKGKNTTAQVHYDFASEPEASELRVTHGNQYLRLPSLCPSSIIASPSWSGNRVSWVRNSRCYTRGKEFYWLILIWAWKVFMVMHMAPENRSVGLSPEWIYQGSNITCILQNKAGFLSFWRGNEPYRLLS